MSDIVFIAITLVVLAGGGVWVYRSWNKKAPDQSKLNPKTDA